MKFSYKSKARNDMVQFRNSINSGTFLYFRWHVYSSQSAVSCMGILDATASGSSGRGGQSHVCAGDTLF